MIGINFFFVKSKLQGVHLKLTILISLFLWPWSIPRAKTSSKILPCIWHYEIDWSHTKDVRPNNRSALAKPYFLWTELLSLESLGCIKRVDYQPHIVNPYSVVFSKKWRCVLDAGQCLNKYCCKHPTKLADLSCIHQLLRQGDYITVNDLD